MEIKISEERIKSTIRNELHCTELLLESEEVYQENYQIRMIRENEIPNLLRVKSSGKDGGTQYLYDISGMRTMKKELEKKVCDKEYIEEFLRVLLYGISQMNRYMLDVNCLLLDPEYIYVKDGKFYFCFYPSYHGQILKTFHHLMEYFVKEIDYGDYQSVMLACGLHKDTMEMQYDLKTLIEKYTNIKIKEDIWRNEYEQVEEINPKEKEKAHKEIIRETPIRRFWNQKKKERWGTWEDLLIIEESSIMEKNQE